MLNERPTELKILLEIALRRWWLIVGSTLLGAGAAYLVMAYQPPLYRAVTTLMVEPARDATSSDYSALIAGERLAVTYSQMLAARDIVEETVVQLRLTESAETIAKRIVAEPIRDSQLIRLTVTDTSTARAAEIADTIVQLFAGRVQALQRERYRSTLDSMESDMTALSTQIEGTQAEIDKVQEQRVAQQARLARLQDELTVAQTELRSLQSEQQENETTIARLSDQITVIEMAEAPKTMARTPYTATVTLRVNQEPAVGPAEYGAILADERLAATYARIMMTRSTLEEAMEQADVSQPIESLSSQIRAESLENTQVINLTVTDIEPEVSTRLANAIATVFVERMTNHLLEPHMERLATLQAKIDAQEEEISRISEEVEDATKRSMRAEADLGRLQARLAEERDDYRSRYQDHAQMQMTAARSAETILVTEPAQADNVPLRPMSHYIPLAALIGCMFGLGAVYLWDYLDESIRTVEDVDRLLGLETWGVITQVPKEDVNSGLLTKRNCPAAENFQRLAAKLSCARGRVPLRTLMIASAAAEEGKSTVIANLAMALARTGLDVIAVDADLRRPRLHGLWGLHGQPGVIDALTQKSSTGNLQRIDTQTVRLLAGGEPITDPTKVLTSPAWSELLADLQQRSDIVLIDSPPVLAVADALMLAPLVDAVIVVIRAGRTSSSDAKEMLVALNQAGARVYGVILNAATGQGRSISRYYRDPGVQEPDEGIPSLADLPMIDRQHLPLGSI